MTKRFSHFVVVADHQTGRMWIDGDTTQVRFEEGAVWNSARAKWECPKSGSDVDVKDDELFVKLTKLLETLDK